MTLSMLPSNRGSRVLRILDSGHDLVVRGVDVDALHLVGDHDVLHGRPL
jgi:hypothetical protein